MTQQEFEKAFTRPAKVYHKGREYEVNAVDFDRKQIGLLDVNSVDGTKWVEIEKVGL
ncbi:hypothetical protein [Parabacteroides sp. Marseille-P3160]|uniref:hypothetical protein n=1 Tax=Parabacteroides sp. Marseille-P3160 TaxID=1917887 RepID=UPI001357F843|nr:hypothetical protein [Parabacteroides sp. Marseille-P3160]